MLAADSNHILATLLVGLLIDAVVGDPRWLYRAVPHPVALLGRLIAGAEARLNRSSAAHRRRAGAALSVSLVALAALAGYAIAAALAGRPGALLVEGILVAVLLAFRGLYDHVAAVAAALDRDLGAARRAVSHIVGRDPESLDAAGVARAAIESTAENFADGVVAPAFWYLLLGLPGLFACKAINTLDSMIGHRSPRYLDFGRAAARLDDWANWAPARLAGGLLAAAAAFIPGASPRRAVRAMRRDAAKHRSPNAGWPEAAMAGALGFALAGPRRYGGTRIDDAWMGDGRDRLGPTDIRVALALYAIATGLLAAAVLVALVGVHFTNGDGDW